MCVKKLKRGKVCGRASARTLETTGPEQVGARNNFGELLAQQARKLFAISIESFRFVASARRAHTLLQARKLTFAIKYINLHFCNNFSSLRQCERAEVCVLRCARLVKSLPTFKTPTHAHITRKMKKFG